MFKRFPATDSSTGGSIDPYKCALPCLFSGAQVTTINGIVRVEDLCPTDRILTRHNGFQQVASLLVRKARSELENAVVIPLGFYTDVCAERDLLLSSHQRILSTEDARINRADPIRALIFAKDVRTAAPARVSRTVSLQAVSVFFARPQFIFVNEVWVECAMTPPALSDSNAHMPTHQQPQVGDLHVRQPAYASS